MEGNGNVKRLSIGGQQAPISHSTPMRMLAPPVPREGWLPAHVQRTEAVGTTPWGARRRCIGLTKKYSEDLVRTLRRGDLTSWRNVSKPLKKFWDPFIPTLAFTPHSPIYQSLISKTISHQHAFNSCVLVFNLSDAVLKIWVN
jgi:hypothetical protein